MSSYQDRIIALIPAWNEERVIGRVVETASRFLPVLVVDDGSTDATPQIAASTGAEILAHESNRGKGAALLTGFGHALEQGAEAVVTLDADGQHDPWEIPKFLSVYRAQNADLVIGKRNFAEMPFPRGYTNPFGSWLLSLAVGERIHDNQSGYRLYDRGLLSLVEERTAGFEFEVEVIGVALKNDLKIAWVGISTIYHTETKSYFHPVKDSLRFLGTVWRARNWRRPQSKNSSRSN